MAASSREPAYLIAAGAVLLAVSAWHPHDYLTWFLEVAPIFMFLPVLIATRRRLPLTPLCYRLIFVHACVLMLGAKYTYAEVPLGFWVRDALGLARNNYDKVGHFMQGFVPAMVTREVLLRATPLRRGGWLSFLVVSVCLGASAFYEFVEWWAALLSAEAAESFLGTQGYVWDTQSDMFMAFCGAILALLLLSRRQDRELAAMGVAP